MIQSPRKTLLSQIPRTEILVTSYTHGYKEKPTKEIGKIQNYFKTVNLGNTEKHSYMDEHHLVYNVLEKGVPHMMCSYLDSPHRRKDVKGFCANMFVIDADHLEHLPYQKKKDLEKDFFNEFDFVQRSFSSSDDYSAPKYHLYKRVTPLGDYSYEYWAYAYKRMMEDYEQRFGITFDHKQHLLKPVFASGKKVHVNRKAKVANLQPYLEESIAEKRKLKSKKVKVNDRVVVRNLADKQFAESYNTVGINYENLVTAIRQMPLIDDYDLWHRILLSVIDMKRKGLIDDNQAYELCELIDNGDGNSEPEMDKLERYGYDRVTLGSLIYELQMNGISTNPIFQLSEKYEMRIDKEWEIDGYLSDNKEFVEEFKKILLENPGKRILLIGDTGIGKSCFLLQLIDEWTKKIEDYKKVFKVMSSLSYSIVSIPRRKLINNLKKDFLTDNHSTVITGSDTYIAGERENVVATKSKLLTTPDHAPILLDMKLKNGERMMRSGYDEATLEVLKHHRLMLLDEAHMLANDSTFKSEIIEKYLAAEIDHMKNGGTVLHTTATPETLSEGSYDLILRVSQKERKNPFCEAGFKVLSGKDTNEVDSMMLKFIREDMKKNSKKKLLVFIENKRLIENFKKNLKENGIRAAAVYSKKEMDHTEEEMSIVGPGVIPDNVQVVLGTTAISAGISMISGYDKQAETWVYCSSSSMNHEITRIIQMSNRFRKKYTALKIFFQESSPEKQDNVFRYHAYVEEQMRKSQNSKAYILRGRDIPIIGDLDEIERNAGLFSDLDGNVHVNIPLIESEGIKKKVYNNYNNYRALIKELENKFGCHFIDMRESVKVSKRDLLKNNNVKGDKKLIVKRIALNEIYYNQLKDEYMSGIKDGELGFVLHTLEGGSKKDLKHFLSTEPEYKLVSQVFKAHQKQTQRKKFCYVDDIRALEKIKSIRSKGRVTLEVQLLEMLEAVFEKHKNGLTFNSSTELKAFLDTCLARKLKEKGLKLEDSRFKPQTFQKLLNVDVNGSNSKNVYKLIGLKNETYVKKKYGLEKISQHKEVA